MARPGAGPQRGLTVQGQRAGRGVEGADAHRVGAEVHPDHPGPGGVGEHLVGVRALLPVGVRAAALVPQDVGGGPERPVVEDGQRGDAAGGVVGRDQVVRGKRQMGGPVAADGLDGAQQGGDVPVGGEGGGDARGALADGVQNRFAVAGADREEGGVGHGVRGAEHGQRSGVPVHGGGGDAEPARRGERPYECPPGAVADHRATPLHRRHVSTVAAIFTADGSRRPTEVQTNRAMGVRPRRRAPWNAAGNWAAYRR